ncbi:nucleoporin FG repeat-containing protein [Poseidonibacter ostreae]|uniref:Uncharacterized protein n=1 Tax=Poseidonibacter ostreae TaxID=2654171 RepID=A0A6L4WX51_9BACT|nr:nucleoporin [Poseidonibacter ostreae]KAB7891435.1 hypothetical protein GBG19_00940 [Poseidonibacter ostreae]
MLDSFKDNHFDNELEDNETSSFGYSKKQQLGKAKKKKEGTFGKSSNGSFGKKPSKGSFGKKPSSFNKKESKGTFGKKPSIFKSKESKGTFGKKPSKGTFGKVPSKNAFKKRSTPKVKKSDVIDEKYLKWLSKKSCVITRQKSERGVGAYNLHIHHIYSRNKGRNDYLAVPLMGYVHSWGNGAYHSNTKADYIKKHNLMIDDIIEYFLECAKAFLAEYIAEGNTIVKKDED